MRNKLISFILLSFLVILPLPSVVEEKLEVTTSVPEDFGIVFPSDALHIDRLYFAFKSSDGYSYLTENMPLIINSMEANSLHLVMLYYGNQAETYNVRMEFDVGQGWVSNEIAGSVVPITIDLDKSDGPQDVMVENVDYGVVNLSVPPAGPRRGESVLDVDLGWDGYYDLEPGMYETDLNIRMTTI